MDDGEKDPKRPNGSNRPFQWAQRYGDLLFGYAIVRVSRREVAEDLVQETLLAGLDARDRFMGDSTEQTWLVGILRKKIADYFRKRSCEDVFALDESADLGLPEGFDQRGHWSQEPAHWPADPFKTLEDREFWATFEDCLTRLPPALGEPFRFREFEQLGTEEVCKVLGLTATNLRVRLYRARTFLRRCLELHWFSDSAK
jgi:RNA polymerase sigma-70 factor (ECF subfamily)